MKKAKKKKLTYWERRNVASEKAINDGAKEVEKKVITAYRQAQSYLTRKVRNLFDLAKQKSGMDSYEARTLLNRKVRPDELVEMQKLAKDIKNPELQLEAQNKLKALVFKERISHAEDLKAKSFLVSKQIADVQLDQSTEYYIDAIHHSYSEASAEATIRRLEDRGISIETWNQNDPPHEFKELSTRYTKNILDSHWKGSNYSKRIWSDTEALAKRLEELFTVESMTGMSEAEMAKAIASEFDASINVARRLIRTEANYMANQAKLKAWEDRGVKHYKLLVVLDLRTSEICKNKSKADKIYEVAKAIVNGADGNYPPFHPWCRTIAVAYFGKRTLSGTRTAIDPVSGKTFKLPKDATYDDWMNKLKKTYSDDEIELQKKKVLNRQKDNADYRRLKNVLGKEYSPKSLDEYQETKYNDSEKWERLRDNFFVKSRIKDGRYGSTVNSEKQAPHMESTVGKGKSYFGDDVVVQRLFDKFAGTGYVERDRSGRRTNKEIVQTDDFVGTAANKKGSKKTHTFKIHHSKKRTHIVPIEERRGQN
ncbi:polymorphic toxin type 50 domain-containing protein [Enterococcus sp. AZ103]|uniref:polymorphic toxin type 50 domain-containing protein n=1 Tax=Enterococcus sp. AZ103 TaxID=2774628 RepID=UPI003F289115